MPYTGFRITKSRALKRNPSAKLIRERLLADKQHIEDLIRGYEDPPVEGKTEEGVLQMLPKVDRDRLLRSLARSLQRLNSRLALMDAGKKNNNKDSKVVMSMKQGETEVAPEPIMHKRVMILRGDKGAGRK